MTKQQFYEKLDNIWYYYKIHIVVGIIVIFSAVFFINDAVHQKAAVLAVAIVGTPTDTAKQTDVQTKATAALVKDPSHKEIKLDFWPVSTSLSDPANSDYQQKFMAMVAAQDLDVILMKKDDFLMYAKQGMFVKLDGVPDIASLTKDSTRLVKSSTNQSQADNTYGILAGDAGQLKAEGIPADNEVVGIIANSKRTAVSYQFIKWLFAG